MAIWDDYSNPTSDFNKSYNDFELDYSDLRNWAFRSDVDSFYEILPKNHQIENDKLFNVSVFYIHPTTLYDSSNWNADTSYFNNNKAIKLCIENQVSVFAGLADIYAPHYREMHIYSYTDTINGYKAFDIAYQDVLSAFQYFINHIKGQNFILVSHSQGTNHAKRLIKEYISMDEVLSSRLILSYLIGMDIKRNELPISCCEDPHELNCFLNWRSFNESYYPKKWKYGNNFFSTNPINFKTDSIWTNKKEHLGVLLPNKKITFKKSLSVVNESGLLWVRLPNNFFIKKYKNNSYHKADFNLFWPNIRLNFINRLSSNNLSSN